MRAEVGPAPHDGLEVIATLGLEKRERGRVASVPKKAGGLAVGIAYVVGEHIREAGEVSERVPRAAKGLTVGGQQVLVRGADRGVVSGQFTPAPERVGDACVDGGLGG